MIKVDAVLGLVTPIGAQMEYDRERVSYFLDFSPKRFSHVSQFEIFDLIWLGLACFVMFFVCV